MNPFTIFKDYIHDKPKIKKAIGLRVLLSDPLRHSISEASKLKFWKRK